MCWDYIVTTAIASSWIFWNLVQTMVGKKSIEKVFFERRSCDGMRCTKFFAHFLEKKVC